MSPRMNKDYVLYNLDEAQKALGEIIADMRSNRDYNYGEYIVDITHVYHHLNTAWNARDADKAATDKCSEEDFIRWRQFPTEDIYLGA
jgi:hypothetical protein